MIIFAGIMPYILENSFDNNTVKPLDFDENDVHFSYPSQVESHNNTGLLIVLENSKYFTNMNFKVVNWDETLHQVSDNTSKRFRV